MLLQLEGLISPGMVRNDDAILALKDGKPLPGKCCLNNKALTNAQITQFISFSKSTFWTTNN